MSRRFSPLLVRQKGPNGATPQYPVDLPVSTPHLRLQPRRRRHGLDVECYFDDGDDDDDGDDVVAATTSKRGNKQKT